jgi:two-component system, chemotaxis family, CheB/CheR fusion protein
LVIFTDVPMSLEKKKVRQGKKMTDHHEVIELNLELNRVKESLQGAHEIMQTSQEELKSTNEELQSTNEELQSTNEELTTSKEEMQSLNEELQTVNAELQNKIDDYVKVNNDMNNLLNSIDIATLFLDKELKIRQFTEPATKIFKLIKSDIGRLFTDQVTDLDYPNMCEDATEVLRTLMFTERTMPTRDNRWFNIRMMPYRTVEDKIEGLVITFIDVTKPKVLEHALLQSQRMLRELIQSVPGVVIGLSSEGVVVEFNPEAEKLFGRGRNAVMGQNYVDLFIPESARKKVAADLKKLLTGTLPNRYQNLVKSGDGEELIIEWAAHKLFDDQGVLFGVISIGKNITSHKSGAKQPIKHPRTTPKKS